jgi:hypothetical protein
MSLATDLKNLFSILPFFGQLKRIKAYDLQGKIKKRHQIVLECYNVPFSFSFLDNQWWKGRRKGKESK